MTTPAPTPTTAPVRQAPPLPSDGERALSIKERIERRIVWNLIERLAAAGFAIVSVYDGGERIKSADPVVAMDAIFSVGIARLFVKRRGHGEHWIKLVLGNDESVISDWSYREDDRDGFHALIKAFKPEDNW